MPSTENISKIFSRLNELKKIFTDNEKLKPVIHILSEFVKETVPLLENINQSVTESTSKIPKATHRINSVTNATELATTEILDLVDTLNQDLKSIKLTINECIEKEKDKEKFLNSIVPLLNKQDAQKFVNEFLKKNDSSNNLKNLSELINKMKDDTGSITISLQVQDITSQQLATVNHLMESVQVCLASLIDDFDNSSMDEEHDSNLNLPDGAAFDPKASYSKSTLHQQEVDSILKKEKQTATQAEIDKLFD